jgi:hypothetical protein
MAHSTVRAHGRVQARYRVGRWPDLSFHAPCCCSVVTHFRGAWSRPLFGDPAVQTISRAWTSTGRVRDRSHWIQDRSAKTRDVTAPDVPCVEDRGRLPSTVTCSTDWSARLWLAEEGSGPIARLFMPERHRFFHVRLIPASGAAGLLVQSRPGHQSLGPRRSRDAGSRSTCFM